MIKLIGHNLKFGQLPIIKRLMTCFYKIKPFKDGFQNGKYHGEW